MYESGYKNTRLINPAYTIVEAISDVDNGNITVPFKSVRELMADLLD